MSKVTFEVEGIRITVEKEDQEMFGRRGGYRQEDHFYRRGQFESNMRRPYYTNPYPSQEDWRHTVNHQYGKQTTGEPLFDESVLDSLRATANKAAEFADNVAGKPLDYMEAFERMYPQTTGATKVSPECKITTRDYEGDVATPIGKLRRGFDPNASMPTMKEDQVDPYQNRRLQLDAMGADYDGLDDITARTKRPNSFMPVMVGVDRVELEIDAMADNTNEKMDLIGAYDKIKHAIACFIGKYIFSGEAVDLPFTQNDRGDYALLLPVPYLSMDILLYVDMVEVDGKHYATAINFDYQADIEGEDEDTPVEQSAKDYILSVLKSYIVHRRDRQYRIIAAQQPSINPNAEGQTDAKDGNNQPTSEAPATEPKGKF
nr:MAG TPA: hypothetical protein [Caudoviricetes sp.]